jgi:hypothetical protein
MNLTDNPGNTTIGIVCKLAGQPGGPPNPSVGDSTSPQSAADTIHVAASNVIAWQILGFFGTNAEVISFCGSYNAYRTNIVGLNLDPDIIQSIICSFTRLALPSPAEVRKEWASFLTTVFTAQLWAVSDSVEYQQLICKGYNTGRLANFKDLESTGLVGIQVTSQIIAYCHGAVVNA